MDRHNLDGTDAVVSYRVLSCSGTARSCYLERDTEGDSEAWSRVIRSRFLTVNRSEAVLLRLEGLYCVNTYEAQMNPEG